MVHDLGLVVTEVAQRVEHLGCRQMREALRDRLRGHTSPPGLNNRADWCAGARDDRLATQDLFVLDDVRMLCGLDHLCCSIEHTWIIRASDSMSIHLGHPESQVRPSARPQVS